MKPFDLRRHEKLIFMAIFVSALALRVLFVLQWNETSYGITPILDAHLYDMWAQDIAQGHLLHTHAFYTSPLYPYILGGVYALFGHSLLIAGFFNAVLSASMITALSLFTFRYFGLDTALTTAFLALVYRPLIFYTAPLTKEALLLFLLTLFIIFAFKSLKKNRLADLAWSGVFLGLCALARGNILLLAPTLLILGFIKWRRAFIKGSLIFVTAILLCIAPATIHNYIVSDSFVVLNYNDGFNFYIGNSPTAKGSNQYPPDISTDPVQEELSTMAVARQDRRGHEVGPAEVSAYWRHRALDFLRQSPWQDLILFKNKFLIFWNNSEAFDNYDIDAISLHTDTLISEPLLPFWPIATLAIFGAMTAWPKQREEVTNLIAFTFTFMLSVLLFYVTDRYRLPVVIFLLPLAGAAITSGTDLIQKKQWRLLGIASALSLISLLIILKPMSEIIPPQKPDVRVFIRDALVAESRGQTAGAERLLTAAMQLYPTDGIVYYNEGHLKALENDFPRSLDAFRQAITLTPTYTLSYYEEAIVEEQLGNKDEAIKVLQQGLEIKPGDPLLQQTLIPLIDSQKQKSGF